MVDPPSTAFRNGLVTLKGRVARMIGVDVDPVVTTNPLLDEAHVYEGGPASAGGRLRWTCCCQTTLSSTSPTPPCSPPRSPGVLKPGGWLCRAHAAPVLGGGGGGEPGAQPGCTRACSTSFSRGAQERDVFPTCYKLNTPARPGPPLPGLGLGELQLHLVAEPGLPLQQSVALPGAAGLPVP